MLIALTGCSPGIRDPTPPGWSSTDPTSTAARAKEFTHEATRGPSAWSIGDRELMTAHVSKVNESAFCVGAHTATATQMYQDAHESRESWPTWKRLQRRDRSYRAEGQRGR